MSVPSDDGPAARDKVGDSVLGLGRKLVTELGLEDAVDTLGRWMAHYIAELIVQVEAASPAERPAREARCAAAILELWRHRHNVSHQQGQFEAEPLLRAIASLDPEAPVFRYFTRLRGGAAGDDDAVTKWLSLADGIDDTARMLVVQCLVSAAAVAGDRSREWISMAEKAGIEDDAPSAALRFVNEQHDLLKAIEPAEAQREKLRNRVGRLKAFVKLAKILENQFAKQLGAVAHAETKSAKPRKSARQRKPKKA